ncbi:nuclear transport factor 2 family protein [Catellatospora sp. NPDC049111]|uniref:nuclear transport factor 2 family protein n=1 Tax=unclassified Catellatospora TaxID=2645785 RepID=UPI003405C3A6
MKPHHHLGSAIVFSMVVIAGPAAASAAPPSQTARAACVETDRAAVAAAFDAWQRGTAPITDVFAPEMTWRIEGQTLVSQEFGSRQEFIDKVLAPFGARMSTTEPFRPVRVQAVICDGNDVVVLWDGRGTANDGKPYENTYAWFLKMKDGKVVDGTAMFDSIAFNDLWNRVQPRE